MPKRALCSFAAALVMLLTIAGCGGSIQGSGTFEGNTRVPADGGGSGQTDASEEPRPGDRNADSDATTSVPTAQPSPGGTRNVDQVCPSVTDYVSHLSWKCIDDDFYNGVFQDSVGWDDKGPALLTFPEKGWVAVQQSGLVYNLGTNPDSAREVALTVTDRMIHTQYGENPTSEIIYDKPVPGLGIEAHRIDLLVTLDPKWASDEGLKLRTERVGILVIKPPDAVRTSNTAYSAMTLLLPDTVKQLWPKVDAAFASVKVV